MLRPSGPALPSLRTNWRTLGRQSFSYAWPIRVSSAYSYWVFELFRIAPYPLRGIRSFKRIGRMNFAGVFFLPKYNTRQTVVRIRDSCLDTGSTPAISTKLDGGRTTVVEVFLYNGTFGLKLDASYLFRYQTKKADQWWFVFFHAFEKIFLKFCYFQDVYSEGAFWKNKFFWNY